MTDLIHIIGFLTGILVGLFLCIVIEHFIDK